MRQELQECRAPPSALLSQIEGLQGRLQDLQAVQSAHKAADEQLARLNTVFSMMMSTC